MNHTDDQLKRVLAEMLPEKLYWRDNMALSRSPYDGREDVLDTELLQICQWIEDALSDNKQWLVTANLADIVPSERPIANASWQQRTIALARVKNVEIV